MPAIHSLTPSKVQLSARYNSTALSGFMNHATRMCRPVTRAKSWRKMDAVLALWDFVPIKPRRLSPLEGERICQFMRGHHRDRVSATSDAYR